MYLAQGLLTNVQCRGGSRSFAKETRNLKMKSVVAGHQKLTTNWAIIKADALTTTWEFSRTQPWPCYGHLLFEVNWKVKDLDKWVLRELTENQKIIILKCHLFLFHTTTMNYFLIGLWCRTKWIFYDNQQMTTSAARPGRNFTAFLKVKLTQKKVMVTVWWSAAHVIYSWPEASIGQKNGPNSSPPCLTTRQTNTSKVEQLGYKILLIHHIHLISCQLITTSLSISTTSCRENASTTIRRKKILSKSSLKTEAQIFIPQ